jgi:hypothetical protein
MEGGSATGVLITDRSQKPGGDPLNYIPLTYGSRLKSHFAVRNICETARGAPTSMQRPQKSYAVLTNERPKEDGSGGLRRSRLPAENGVRGGRRHVTLTTYRRLNTKILDRWSDLFCRRGPRPKRLSLATSLNISVGERPLGTSGLNDNCLRKVTENAMSQHLTHARLSRGVFGALVAMIAFTAALFSAAHHFAG